MFKKVFWINWYQYLALVYRNTLVLQCFDAVGWVTGMPSGLQKFCHNSSQKFTFGDRLDPEYLWKNGPVKSNLGVIFIMPCPVMGQYAKLVAWWGSMPCLVMGQYAMSHDGAIYCSIPVSVPLMGQYVKLVTWWGSIPCPVTEHYTSRWSREGAVCQSMMLA